jgi:CheY-like chemotaxis protein
MPASQRVSLRIFLRSRCAPIHCPGPLWAGLARISAHASRVARILIIDDDEPFRTLLRGMLLEAGHTVVEAPNGFEALKLIRAEPVELVLTDLMMPYGGLATIRILRNEFPHLGIIAISGGGTFRLNFAQSLGAHRTLTKPFTAEQLSAAITEVLSAHPAPKPGS